MLSKVDLWMIDFLCVFPLIWWNLQAATDVVSLDLEVDQMKFESWILWFDEIFNLKLPNFTIEFECVTSRMVELWTEMTKYVRGRFLGLPF